MLSPRTTSISWSSYLIYDWSTTYSNFLQTLPCLYTLRHPHCAHGYAQRLLPSLSGALNFFRRTPPLLSLYSRARAFLVNNEKGIGLLKGGRCSRAVGVQSRGAPLSDQRPITRQHNTQLTHFHSCIIACVYHVRSRAVGRHIGAGRHSFECACSLRNGRNFGPASESPTLAVVRHTADRYTV